MKKLLLTSVLLSSLSAQAGGDKVGGGGDVVLCPKASVKFRLLDSLEAELPEHEGGIMRMNLGGAQASIAQKIQLMHDRLAAFDSTRADRYRDEVRKIYADLEASKAGLPSPHGLATRWERLPDIDDANENFTVPAGCTKAQLVKQDDPIDATDWTYRFVGEYLDRLNRDEFVATLYHEAIYRELRKFGHQHSRYARHLNAFLFSGAISAMRTCDYVDFAARAEMPDVTLFHRLHTETKNIECDRDQKLAWVFEADYRVSPEVSWPLTHVKFGSAEQLEEAWLMRVGTPTAGKSVPIYPKPAPDNVNAPGAIYTLGFEADGSFRLSMSRIRVQVGTDGKVVRTWTPQEFANQLTLEDRTGVEKVVQCVADALGGRNRHTAPDDLAKILVQALEQGARHDREALAATQRECLATVKENRGKRRALSAEEIDAEIEQILKYGESLRRWPVVHVLRKLAQRPKPETCEMQGPAAGLAVLAGSEIGFIQARCLMTNGDVRRYVGPRLTLLTLGVGAHVSYDKYRVNYEHQMDSGKSLLIEDESGFGARRGFGTIKKPSEGNIDGGTIPDSEPRVGYGAWKTVLKVGANFGFRFGNRHERDLSLLMRELLRGETDELLEN